MQAACIVAEEKWRNGQMNGWDELSITLIIYHCTHTQLYKKLCSHIVQATLLLWTTQQNSCIFFSWTPREKHGEREKESQETV